MEELIPSITEISPEEDLLRPIKEKYGNDINKLAGAFKSMQARANQIENQYKVPEKFEIAKEHEEILGNDQISSLTEIARKGEFSQKQFDTLIANVYEFKKTHVEKTNLTKQERDAILKDKEQHLKDFYTNKLPDQVLNKVFNLADTEDIKALDTFRLETLNKTKTPTPGVNMIEQPINKPLLIRQKENELMDYCAKVRLAPIEVQNELNEKIKALSHELVALKHG